MCASATHFKMAIQEIVWIDALHSELRCIINKRVWDLMMKTTRISDKSEAYKRELIRFKTKKAIWQQITSTPLVPSQPLPVMMA
jgi:hypothetical protein